MTLVRSTPATTATRNPLPFTGPWLLAPMQGVTEPCFRDLVLERNPSDQLGGAFTEFVRVVDHPVPTRILHDHLGPKRFDAPVGLQLMGSDLDALAKTARAAVDAGAPLLDLNFGCPAKGAIRGCSGSAILRNPHDLERVVKTCVSAVPDAPVTAKIRAGFDDDSLLEDIARAAEQGGAALLTVHCRTRLEGYRDTEDWNRLSRAVDSVSIPVCGNGGVWQHADLERLRQATGCEYAMVGRAALADPWIFSGKVVDAAEAATFLLEYAQELSRRHGMRRPGIAGRLKQLLRTWTAGDLVREEERKEWLAERDPAALFGRLAAQVGGRIPEELVSPPPRTASASE